MEEEKEILTKGERILNLIFYIFRYTLYIIAFAWLSIIIGEVFGILLAVAFWFLSQLHMDYSIKIQKANISNEIHKYDKIMRKHYEKTDKDSI